MGLLNILQIVSSGMTFANYVPKNPLPTPSQTAYTLPSPPKNKAFA